MALPNTLHSNDSNEPDFDEQFFSEFEYLHQRVQGAVIPSIYFNTCDYNFDTDEVYLSLKKLDASTLSLNELLLELEKREIEAKGFFADDAQVLQSEYDKELEQYVTCKRMEIFEARRLEAERVAREWRMKLKDEQLEEEKVLVDQDSKIRWLHRIRGVTTSSNDGRTQYVRIQVRNDTAARILAKALWTSNVITSLDLSRMNLSDLMGAYVCGALRYNRSVVKLELGENNLGEKTCLALEVTMRSNDVLKYISLESNPLCSKSDNSEIICAQALASIIETTSSLTTLSLWRCGIGPIGGEMIAQSIVKNHSLTCLESGYNDWKYEHIKIITCKLDANIASHKLQMDAKQQGIEEAQEKRLREECIERIEGEKKSMEDWLTQQELLRCQRRVSEIKLAEEAAKEIAHNEEERRRQEKLTLEALAVKQSKKKNKKKGVKGKNSGT
jgi:hypothetical protein